jgi:hypothetical protein
MDPDRHAEQAFALIKALNLDICNRVPRTIPGRGMTLAVGMCH